MKKMYKGMLLVLCAILLVVASVMGTLAYLQDDTQTITNTFTVGKVAITLQEYTLNADGSANTTTTTSGITNIKLIPGRTVHKNPFITVEQGSEACYLFAKVENGLGDNVTIHMVDGWTRIGTSNYWMYEEVVTDAMNPISIFDYFICSTAIQNETVLSNNTIAITAYAVQAEGFDSAADAWAASGFGNNN